MYTKEGMIVTIPYSTVENAHKLYSLMNTRQKGANGFRLDETERLQNAIAEIVVTIIVNEVGGMKLIPNK